MIPTIFGGFIIIFTIPISNIIIYQSARQIVIYIIYVPPFIPALFLCSFSRKAEKY